MNNKNIKINVFKKSNTTIIFFKFKHLSKLVQRKILREKNLNQFSKKNCKKKLKKCQKIKMCTFGFGSSLDLCQHFSIIGFFQHKTHDAWNMTQDTKHMTHGTSHNTHDTWHMTHDLWNMTYETGHMINH